jgi:cyclophilin family peptidyl-prolyl cis-trans isomerase
MLIQAPAQRAVLEAEHSRAAGLASLREAIARPNAAVQARAARAVGRLEDTTHSDLLLPLLQATDSAVRSAAYGALAQLKAAFDYRAALQRERNPGVRATIYEAIGRMHVGLSDVEAALSAGLGESNATVRAGAARGLESLIRLNSRAFKPSAATRTAMHATFLVDRAEQTRELILLALNASADSDSAVVTAALADPSPQVRRLGVLAGRRWVDDPSPLVRVQALRVAGTCERAAAAVSDESEHVVLAAVDVYMRERCGTTLIAPQFTTGRTWRVRARALTALAFQDTAVARASARAMQADSVWQVRVAVAQVAKVVRDTALLATLVKDANPNVVLEALNSADDATRALRSDHAGLLLAAAQYLKNAPDLRQRLPRIIGAFNRLTADGSMTMRDPRMELLSRIGAVDDTTTTTVLTEALADRDPAIAAQAASLLSARTGTTVAPITTRLPIPPIPPASYVQGLEGAQARITMRGLGTMTVDLLTIDAPVTVAVFAQLAESGQYNGLTFHRIVPNFVIQGGSPGADEFDGRTREFMRDEVGFARQLRGTIGISTRGRDTGDGQIYFNLVDNFRLDRDYTVMATMRDGLAVMDSVQEGDVIERVEIIRRAPSRAARR